MTTDTITADDVVRIARSVARRYARRCWWADPGDLEGEASIAVLTASSRWDPQVGVPFDGYAARAAANALHNYLWRESGPVTGGMHDPRAIRGPLRRASLEIEDDEGHASPRPEVSVGAQQLDALSEASWRLRVRERIREVLKQVRNGDLAIEVMTRGRTADEVRESKQAKIVRVYDSVYHARRAIKDDPEMCKLFLELED